MADIKWIKVTVDLFDDEKIALIEAMPAADSILVIWFKLLCFAGKQNNGGIFILNDRIPYTEEMLAAIFRRTPTQVRLALKTFEDLGMIEIVDGVVTIPSWKKHQSMMDKNEYQRQYMREYRERKKLEAQANVNDDVNYTLITSEEMLEDKKKEIRNKKEEKHRYGEYQHVLLSDSDYLKLKEQFPDYEKRIKNLDEYLENNPKKHYANHYLTIKTWARKDAIESKEEESGESYFAKAIRKVNK